MSQMIVKRITLFKIPNEQDITRVLELYSTLQADAKKVRLPIKANQELTKSSMASLTYCLVMQARPSTLLRNDLKDIRYVHKLPS